MDVCSIAAVEIHSRVIWSVYYYTHAMITLLVVMFCHYHINRFTQLHKIWAVLCMIIDMSFKKDGINIRWFTGTVVWVRRPACLSGPCSGSDSRPAGLFVALLPLSHFLHLLTVLTHKRHEKKMFRLTHIIDNLSFAWCQTVIKLVTKHWGDGLHFQDL